MIGADVGHSGVSRFIGFDNDGEIVIVEVAKKKYTVYSIPANIQPGQLVTAHHARHRTRQPVLPGVRGEPGLQVRSGRRDQSDLVHSGDGGRAVPDPRDINPAASADPSCAREVMPSLGKIR